MPAMGGGQGVAGGIASQNDLTKMGLKLKTGDVQAEGSKIDPKIIELAQQVQANMPNFAYFSGFNDKFHQEKSPSSSHTTGRAMDFALSKQPSVEEGQEITKWLKSMGASVAIDEYNNPSAKATAGHIHAQIPGYADGGIASTPQIAMVAEKGPEAMIPLDKGAIPINLNMDAHLAKIFETGFGELSAQFAKLNDIDLLKSTVSDFKNGNFGLADPKDMLKSESTEARASLDQGAKVYEKLLAEALEKQAAQQAEQSSRMIDALFEMIRTQKDSNSIQERILQTSM
jgi:SLT domain-containing protein